MLTNAIFAERQETKNSPNEETTGQQHDMQSHNLEEQSMAFEQNIQVRIASSPI
jgi:hypothetical protein